METWLIRKWESSGLCMKMLVFVQRLDLREGGRTGHRRNRMYLRTISQDKTQTLQNITNHSQLKRYRVVEDECYNSFYPPNSPAALLALSIYPARSSPVKWRMVAEGTVRGRECYCENDSRLEGGIPRKVRKQATRKREQVAEHR